MPTPQRRPRPRVLASHTAVPATRGGSAAVVFALVESAQARWRAVNAPHLVSLVRAGARLERGHLVERPSGQPPFTAA